MSLEVKPYDLPDAELLTGNSSVFQVKVWEPAFLCIVLGQSNHLENSIIIENVQKDGIPVYKRPSGGETVVLSAKMSVISIVKPEKVLKSPRVYFNDYNGKIIRALKTLGIKSLSLKGISDICLGKQKILGSSIYRNKDMVFYHAVLNRAESVELLERYLRHPPREPEYRGGRSHKDFVTSLHAEGYYSTPQEIHKSLTNNFISN